MLLHLHLNLFGVGIFDIFSAVHEGVTPRDFASLASIVVHGSVREGHLCVQVRQVNHNVIRVRVHRGFDVRLEHGSKYPDSIVFKIHGVKFRIDLCRIG